MADPKPGDFGCISYDSTGGHLITFGEKVMNALGDKGLTQYDHAFIVVERMSAYGVRVIEARPRGAGYNTYGVNDERIAWSHLELTQEQRSDIVDAAESFLDTPYSWLDYAAIAAHSLHLPVPGLKDYIKSTKSMICSQLVDQCYRDAGIELFPGRWPGYCTPSELGVYCS